MLAWLAFLPLLPFANAFWIIAHGSLTRDRLDPIVSPNLVASHMHRVLGGSAFGASYDFASLRNSTCTTASITVDKSNYWAPQLVSLNSCHEPDASTGSMGTSRSSLCRQSHGSTTNSVGIRALSPSDLFPRVSA